MRINHNIMAMNTSRQLGIANTSQSKSMQKLSSGLKINSAADDAAGLAISEKMRGQIRGLNQASSNAQDGISMIQTAEGALNETTDILQRMRELAVQSSNGTLQNDDREAIQNEINELVSEIDRIANDTEFNEKKLLNGSIGLTSNKTADTANVGTVTVNTSTLDSGNYTVTVTNTANAEVADVSDGGINDGAAVVATDIDATSTATQLGKYSIEVTDDANNVGNFVFTWKDSDGNAIAEVNNIAAAAGTVTLTDSTYGEIVLTDNAGGDWQTGQVTFEVEADFDIAVTNAASGAVSTVSLTDHNSDSVTLSGFGTLEGIKTNITDNAATVALNNNAVKFQIGANANQETKLAINDMDASSLGVSGLNVSSESTAETAITTIQSALDKVSTERAKLGATQNRLEHTISNLDTSSENLQASESRIRDVDMAKEMMEYTKNNILAQAAQSMLAQANQAPQSVLQLLQ